MLTTAIAASLICARPVGHSSVVTRAPDGAPPWRPAAPHPAVARWDRGGDCPALAGGRAKSTRRNGPHRTAYARLPPFSPTSESSTDPPDGRRTATPDQADRMRGPPRSSCCCSSPESFVPAEAVAEPAFPAPAPWASPSPVELRRRPVRGTRRTRTPRATAEVDLRGSPGSAVLAARATGWSSSQGIVAGRPVVSIDHAGGLRTTYEPVDPAVGAGCWWAGARRSGR